MSKTFRQIYEVHSHSVVESNTFINNYIYILIGIVIQVRYYQKKTKFDNHCVWYKLNYFRDREQHVE